MAENTKQTEIIDADAFDPIPKRLLALSGKRYPVLSLQDVDYSTYQKTQRLREHLAAIPDEDDQMAFLRDLIGKIVPTLPKDALVDMSINRIGFIFGKVTAPIADEVVADPLASSPPVSN